MEPMAKDYISLLSNLLRQTNPVQAKKFDAFFKNCDELYHERANRFFEQYEKLLSHLGKNFEYSIDCYNQMNSEMLVERINFLQTGKYSNESFDDVRKKLYENPETFDHHMHGLALAQFLWWDQYQRFSFFADNLAQYNEQTKNYLEVGGGHGLYIAEALRQFNSETKFDLVDISPTSIEMSKVAVGTGKVNFTLADMYTYHSKVKYDFITIGEVIEHLEDPKSMMIKLRNLLTENGVIYITTPANAPMIDHIYLFNSGDEIRSFLSDCGLAIIEERALFAENMEEKKAIKNKVPLMFAAFIQKA
jgi:2-polyprenyl-3-methyl-5-hydroxy-6-metoxy-1,4-benzoquinol methylase